MNDSEEKLITKFRYIWLILILSGCVGIIYTVEYMQVGETVEIEGILIDHHIVQFDGADCLLIRVENEKGTEYIFLPGNEINKACIPGEGIVIKIQYNMSYPNGYVSYFPQNSH